MDNQRRGRPREFDEDVAIAEALDLFWRKGYVGATTRALESELHIKQSSLYNAFGSKRELLGVVLDRYIREFDSTFIAPLLASVDGSALDRFFDPLLDWICVEDRRGCLLFNLASEPPADDDVAERARSVRRRMREAFTDTYIRRGVAADASVARADTLVSAVIGLNTSARAGASREELTEMAACIQRELVA